MLTNKERTGFGREQLAKIQEIIFFHLQVECLHFWWWLRNYSLDAKGICREAWLD